MINMTWNIARRLPCHPLFIQKNEKINKSRLNKILQYFSDREKWVEGKPYTFSDVFYKDEFSKFLFDYLDEKISKEEFKEKIQAKIAYAHTPFILNNRNNI